MGGMEREGGGKGGGCRGKTSSCPKRSDSCQPANQLSSALTDLDVLLYISVCVSVTNMAQHFPACASPGRPVCLSGPDSADRSLSEDWQLWHTLRCMEDTCCHRRFRWSTVAAWQARRAGRVAVAPTPTFVRSFIHVPLERAHTQRQRNGVLKESKNSNDGYHPDKSRMLHINCVLIHISCALKKKKFNHTVWQCC